MQKARKTQPETNTYITKGITNGRNK